METCKDNAYYRKETLYTRPNVICICDVQDAEENALAIFLP